MSADNPPNIVDPIEPGHVSEREIADGNDATNPDETLGSDESDSSDESDNSNIRMALDEQIAQATQTRDRLQKQRQLENIN